MSRNSCLLISNNPIDQAIFAMALNEVSQYSECLIADTEFEAMNLLTSSKVKPDFIFADYNMCGFDALRFIRSVKISRSLCRIPVILHCDRNDINEKLKSSGAHALYCKDYSVDGIKNLLMLYLVNDISPILLN